MSSLNSNKVAAAITLAVGSVSTAQAGSFPVTNTNDAGAGSLRDAINLSNGNAGADTIDLTAIANSTITLASDLPTITDEVTFLGANATVDGNGNAVFYSYGGNTTINDMTITGGIGTYYNYSRYGGGIYSYNASLQLNNVTVTGNTADTGGGIAVGGGPGLVINGSTISNNDAGALGGGIRLIAAGIDLTSSTVSSNTSQGAGGGIHQYAVQNTLYSTITDSEISNNSAGTTNGGVYLKYNVDISNSLIAGNTAGSYGGLSIYGKYGSFCEIRNTVISGNTATSFAGLTANNGTSADSTMTCNLQLSTITSNTANNEGGGITLLTAGGQGATYNSYLNAAGSIVSGNAAGIGGPDIDTLGIINQPDTALKDPIQMLNNGSLTPRIIRRSLGDNVSIDDYIRGNPRGGNTLVATLDHSLFGSGPQSTVDFNLDAVSSGLLGLDPLLMPLASMNFGPGLFEPGAGSPALDVADPNVVLFCFGTDILGNPRPDTSSQLCDLGAIELAAAAPPPAPQAIPVLDRIGMMIMTLGLGLLAVLGLRRRRG